MVGKLEGGPGGDALVDAVRADHGVEDGKAEAGGLHSLQSAPAVAVIVEARRWYMLFCLPGTIGWER